MVSRIITKQLKERYPDSDGNYPHDAINLVKGRCLKFYFINSPNTDLKYSTENPNEGFSPLIAKGNKFDGVKALW